MPKKIRFVTEYAVLYIKKYLWIIILGAVFGSICYYQRGWFIRNYQVIRQGDINLGSEGFYTINQLPANIQSQISQGFTVVSENNKSALSPIVSQMLIGDNNLSYTFTFRDNLYWQNGKKFNSSDINLNIPGVTVTTIPPDHVKITLSKPYSPLLSLLSRPLFLKDSLIGIAAPYSVQNISYQDGYIKQLTLQPNQLGQKLNYHYYSTAQDLITAFKLGEVDEITTTNLNPQIANWPRTKISQTISDQQYLGLFINTAKISNKQDRQALAYATPKTDDKNSRALGPISPNSWAYNPEIKNYNYNPTRAQELLVKDTLKQINILVSDPSLLTTADKIKHSWESVLSLKVNVTVANQQIDLNNYDTFLGFGQIPIDPDQYSFWHSTQTKTNITHFNNSRIDKLLEEGRQTVDQIQRKSIYYDFQKFLLEESPVVFLEFPTTYTISRLK